MNNEDIQKLLKRNGARPVLHAHELDALPDSEGAWWRAHHTRMARAIEEFEAEFGPNSWEDALLSVFPQPFLGNEHWDEDEEE